MSHVKKKPPMKNSNPNIQITVATYTNCAINICFCVNKRLFNRQKPGGYFGINTLINDRHKWREMDDNSQAYILGVDCGSFWR